MNYIITVRFFNCISRSYRLPKDLKMALDAYNLNKTNEDWKKFLLGALINVPLAPYLRGVEGVEQNPPIATGEIVEATAVEKMSKKQKKFPNTRSQFVKISSKEDKNTIKIKLRYMQHDYNILSKLKIHYDISRIIFDKGHHVGKIIDRFIYIPYIARLLVISPLPF